MNASPPPTGGAFLAESPPLTQVSIPEDKGADAHLMARTAEEFLQRCVLPVRERLETQEDGLMRRLVQQAGMLGLLAGNVPQEYGGLALPKTTVALLGEKMALDLSFAISAGIHSGVALLPLALFGTPSQQAQWLPRLARGEIVGAFALSEANAGSDALSAQARATLCADGTHYRLSGVKQWITNAGFADLFTVFAKVEGTQLTAFLVERAFPGVSLGPEEKKLGLRGSSTRRLILDHVPVPVENVVGAIGQGHRPALSALNLGRFAIAATALGSAKDALRGAAEYARSRRQFGRPLAEFGLMQHKLGEMAARLFALESMVSQLAGYWDRRGAMDAAGAEEYALECAVLKFWGTEAQDYVVDEALQIHGGYGVSEAFPIARAYRDARVFRIFEGTNEINRLAVVDQALRRVRSGRLELPPVDSLTGAAKSDDPGVWVGEVRRAVLFVLARFRTTLGDEWRPQQEIAAALADMIAGLYALESAWLRCRKMAASEWAQTAVRVLGQEVCTQTREQARFALAALGPEGTQGCSLADIDALLTPPQMDTIGLRRQLASAVVERGGSPWG